MNTYKNYFNKDGFKNYTKREYLPYFDFKPEWINSEEGQRKLESLRIKFDMPYQGQTRRLAKLYTSKIKIPQNAEMIKFVDKTFFKTTTLYGSLCIIYKTLTLQPKILRLAFDRELLDYFTITLDKYLKNKKEQGNEWKKLTKTKQEDIKLEILSTLWANLADLKVIKFVSGEKNYKYVMAHENFDLELIINSDFLVYQDLPMINVPLDWELKDKEQKIPTGGGYYTNNIIKRNFIRKSIQFGGDIIIKQPLVNLINKLQRMPWAINTLIFLYLNQEFKNVKYYYDTDYAEIINPKEDIIQQLNTWLFLDKFARTYPTFYYPYNCDWRGRIYPIPIWFASATSSKLIRSYICLKDEIPLENEDACDWLKLKIAQLKKYEGKSYFDLIKQVDENFEEFNYEQKDIKDFKTAQIYQLYQDIKKKKSAQLIEIDTVASALGFIGICMNDQKIMEAVGLTGKNSDDAGPRSKYERDDIYMQIAKRCEKILPDPYMRLFLTRPNMKSLIMPRAYGLTSYEAINKLIDIIDKYRNEDNPKKNDFETYVIETITPETATNENVLKSAPIDWNKEKISELNWLKRKYFAAWFYYECFEKILNEEYSALQKFLNLMKEKMINYTFENEFLQNNNSYTKTVKIYKKMRINGKPHEFTMYRALENTHNKTKEKRGAAANFVHGLDSFIVHYVVANLPPDVNIITIHDCFITSPQYTSLVIEKIHEAYIVVQNHVKNLPVFTEFHKEGSIPIISKNMVKISLAEHNSDPQISEEFEDDDSST